MLTFTKQLLHLRRIHVALTLGTYRTVYQDDQVLLFERHYEEERYWVAINFSIKGENRVCVNCEKKVEQ